MKCFFFRLSIFLLQELYEEKVTVATQTEWSLETKATQTDGKIVSKATETECATEMTVIDESFETKATTGSNQVTVIEQEDFFQLSTDQSEKPVDWVIVPGLLKDVLTNVIKYVVWDELGSVVI